VATKQDPTDVPSGHMKLAQMTLYANRFKISFHFGYILLLLYEKQTKQFHQIPYFELKLQLLAFTLIIQNIKMITT